MTDGRVPALLLLPSSIPAQVKARTMERKPLGASSSVRAHKLCWSRNLLNYSMRRQPPGGRKISSSRDKLTAAPLNKLFGKTEKKVLLLPLIRVVGIPLWE